MKGKRATKAQVAARTDEILKIRLLGAEFTDLREFVREKEKEPGSPWHLKDGEKPLSDSQLWRYVARTDEVLAAQREKDRDKLINRHYAQRRALYARAMETGDLRTALAVAKDEAELEGLYEVELAREVADLRRLVEQRGYVNSSPSP